jgi:hypothetical protein
VALLLCVHTVRSSIGTEGGQGVKGGGRGGGAGGRGAGGGRGGRGKGEGGVRMQVYSPLQQEVDFAVRKCIAIDLAGHRDRGLGLEEADD